jgi:hypothetical protein
MPRVYVFALTVDDKPTIYIQANKVPDCLHEAASIVCDEDSEEPASLHALGGATDELLEIVENGVDPDILETSRWVVTGQLTVTLRRKEPMWRREQLTPPSCAAASG